MILKVIKVLWFMFMRLWIYGWLRLTGSQGMQARLLKDLREWSAHVLRVFDVDLEVRGGAHVPVAPGRKLIIMSNHQSQLDIPTLTKALDRLTGFVAKRELSRIPLLNYWMKQLGCVIIDRADKRGAHQALEAAARGMGDNPLVVFPEGTRSRDGTLLPFKLGGTRLALLAQAIIVPALIENSRDAVENRKAIGEGPVRVRLTFFPPLDTQGLDEGKASQNKIKDYVEQCWRNPNAHN
ncbi:MAG: lysophospholipid acyltransferase family protein [Fibrobacteria bacterium]